MATLYYLNWDKEDRTEIFKPAFDLFLQIHFHEPPVSLTNDTFNQVYRKIAEIDIDEPEEAFEQWNTGTGHETAEFYDTETRDMCIGDIIKIDGTHHLCLSIDWTTIQISDE